MTVRLVYGPPGAGKSTYAREHAADRDLVIDLDTIRESVPNEQTARQLRSLMEAGARGHDGDVWIVRTLAKADERADFVERVGVDESIPLTVDAETAKERVRARDGSDEKFPAIERWWADYTPDAKEAEMAEKNETTEGTEAAEGTVDSTTPQAAEQTVEARNPATDLPGDVPVSEMSLEDQLTYWKRRSRSNEREAREAREQVEALSEKQPEGNEKVAGPDPAQREVFEARVEAALASRPEFADVPFAKHLDLSTFVGDDGRVDRESVAAFFDSLPQGANNTTAGTPAGWGSNRPFEAATGVDAGAELYRARRNKN